MTKVLVVDDDERLGTGIRDYLARAGFEAQWVGTHAEGLEAIESESFRAAIVDLMLPDGPGLSLLDQCAARGIHAIVITGHASLDYAIGSLRSQAADFYVKPLKLEVLAERVGTLLNDDREDDDRLGGLEERTDRLGPIIGQSVAMRRLLESMRTVAPTDATVLIVGDSGTGKELVARVVHQLSRRAAGPYLAINCGAIAHDLIASELFGHERGSFTGASRRHIGIFEQADQGTVFLDEISEMPLELQVNLLRVLETGTFRRVGGNDERRSSVRLVAATNVPPDRAVKEGRLREDLFFRLSEFPLAVPPLTARESDVELLAREFVRELSERYRSPKVISDAALAALARYTWPGNVRELRNVVHGAFIVAESEIDEAQVAERLETMRTFHLGEERISPGLTIQDMERQLILRTLEHFDGRKPAAAQALGISLKTLYNRLNDYAREQEGES